MPESSRDRELRPLPDWAQEASFGIFVHWGPYSVPAWAEPTGALGKVPPEEWFAHNPYAEWYANTIRIEGSPAAAHHLAEYGGAPYEEFLDAWTADRYDPAEWAKLFRAAGADYVIPVTKHHDGVTLWDAPGSGDLTTVARGPRRDLIEPLADAVRAEGIRFGVYYSGGLDWSFSDLPPLETPEQVHDYRPVDDAYARYATAHVRDLIDRYRPSVIWNDIGWPDAGREDGSLDDLLRHHREVVPDGIVNDRWGPDVGDYRTSEYSQDTHNESGIGWENNRGLGFSFGYNRIEGAGADSVAPRARTAVRRRRVAGRTIAAECRARGIRRDPRAAAPDAGRHRPVDGGGQAAHRPSTARLARGSRGAADDGRVGAELGQRRTTRRRHGSADRPRRPWRGVVVVGLPD